MVVDEYSKNNKAANFLGAIVEFSNDAIWSNTLEGTLLTWNKAAEKLYGFTAQEVVGHHINLIIAPEHQEEFFKILKQIVRGEQVDHFKAIHLCKGDLRVVVSLTISPIKDHSNKIIGTSTIARNITELEQVKVKFNDLLESAPDAMVIVNQQGKIVIVNSQTDKMFGYNRDHLLGKPVEFLIPDRFASSHTEQRNQYFKKPRVRPMGEKLEIYGLRHDGTEIPLEISLSPMKTAEDVLVIAAIRDVTERQRADQIIQNTLKEKEVLIKEIHHRVKNNMQVIASLLNIQSHYVKDVHDLAIFQECQSRIYSMALVHQKLYQSKDLAQIDFAEYLRTLSQELMVRSYQVNPEVISIRIEAEEVFLEIDTAVPLGLIVSELLSNALKYAFPDDQHGEIVVQLKQVEGNFLTLIVEDNGVGLPNDFDLKNSKSLGLQIVQDLTHQLKGYLEIYGQNGTHVALTFPIRR